MSKRSGTVPWAPGGALIPAAWVLLVPAASVAAQAPEDEAVPLEFARLLVGSPFAAPFDRPEILVDRRSCHVKGL